MSPNWETEDNQFMKFSFNRRQLVLQIVHLAISTETQSTFMSPIWETEDNQFLKNSVKLLNFSFTLYVWLTGRQRTSNESARRELRKLRPLRKRVGRWQSCLTTTHCRASACHGGQRWKSTPSHHSTSSSPPSYPCPPDWGSLRLLRHGRVDQEEGPGKEAWGKRKTRILGCRWRRWGVEREKGAGRAARENGTGDLHGAAWWPAKKRRRRWRSRRWGERKGMGWREVRGKRWDRGFGRE